MTSIPEIGHRVTVKGREPEGMFVVLLVDPSRNTADLLRMSGVRRIEESIPLDLLDSLQASGPDHDLPNHADADAPS